MADWLSIGAGVLGGLIGRKASPADKAAALQMEIYKQYGQPSLEEVMNLARQSAGLYQDAVKRGDYDAEVQIRNLSDDFERMRSTRLLNDATNARVMGYKAGDSEPLLQQADTDRRMQESWDNKKLDIRLNAKSKQFADAAGVAQMYQAAGGNATSMGNVVGNAVASQTDRSQDGLNLLGAVIPFLDKLASAGGGTTAAPAMPVLSSSVPSFESAVQAGTQRMFPDPPANYGVSMPRLTLGAK